MDFKVLMIALLLCDLLFLIMGAARRRMGRSAVLFAVSAVLSVAAAATAVAGADCYYQAENVSSGVEESGKKKKGFMDRVKEAFEDADK